AESDPNPLPEIKWRAEIKWAGGLPALVVRQAPAQSWAFLRGRSSRQGVSCRAAPGNQMAGGNQMGGELPAFVVRQAPAQSWAFLPGGGRGTAAKSAPGNQM